MKHLFTALAVITTIGLVACAERHTPADADARESRPPTAAEVPPADIPPEVPPAPVAQPAEPPPEAEPSQPPEPETEETTVAPEPETGQPLETIETDSGLIIEVLRIGTGDEVRPGETIVVHYHGTLADGRTFDSSYDRGEPATLNLFQTVRGWQEGIPGMRVGGKRRLIIPSELGYGRRGTGNIPPNSMLIFEIEVLDMVR